MDCDHATNERPRFIALVMPQQLHNRLHRRRTCHLVHRCCYAYLGPPSHLLYLLLGKPVIAFLRCVCCSAVALPKALRS